MSEKEIKALLKENTKRKVGRPAMYNVKLANEICERMAAGESLLKIVEDEHMPDYRTVMKWRIKYTKFGHNYARAREQRAETWAEQLIHIAQTEEDVQRARLITDNMKWVSSKLLPKVYGDNVQIEQNVQVNFTNSIPRPKIIDGDAISSVPKQIKANTDTE